MIESSYEKEMLSMRAILNSKTIILNVQYKLMHDNNVKKIFNLIPQYVNDINSLNWNDKYFFEKEVSEVLLTLNTLLHVLLESERYLNIPSEDFIVKCKHFSDSNGKNMMYLFSYIPVLQLIDENLKYKNSVEHNSEAYLANAKKFQNESLFEKILFSEPEKFPADSRLIDYSLKHKINKIRTEEYDSYRKSEIENELKILVDKMTSSDNTMNSKVELGCVFWDAKTKAIIERKNKFNKSISSVLNALSNSVIEDKDIDKD